ncbi:hypothetical protein SNEBB_000056 [Seison nebaliae]|nr:hypothetical protein SNEBB_000056 [Seison nebaliae]
MIRLIISTFILIFIRCIYCDESTEFDQSNKQLTNKDIDSTFLQNYTFDDNEKYTLNFSNNSLESLPFLNIFTSHNRDENYSFIIDLSYNPISQLIQKDQLNDDIKVVFRRLDAVIINNVTTISCDCHLKDFWQYMNKKAEGETKGNSTVGIISTNSECDDWLNERTSFDKIRAGNLRCDSKILNIFAGLSTLFAICLVYICPESAYWCQAKYKRKHEKKSRTAEKS